MSETVPTPPTARAALLRAALLLGFWIVLMGTSPLDVAFGVLVAASATWVSLFLLPPRSVRLRVAALPGMALRFAWQSVMAGVDVARRAFDPRLPLRPGWVEYPVRFPPGPMRNTFAALTSLLPGTVPAGEKDGAMLYHCLDIGQPVLEQLAAEEAVLRQALSGPQS
jgi:multicomponent Na+:H+ antiporter subunit E